MTDTSTGRPHRPGTVVPPEIVAATSTPTRIHDPGAGVDRSELQLAARNHGMPMEMLRHDLTPIGLHYLLIHYDIPALDTATWRLRIDGLVDRPLDLGLDDLQRRPRRSVRVTMECAGNGRALLDPRPQSQPWLRDAVGTAEWTGTPLAPLLREAGLAADATEVVFTGADHGLEGGVEQDYRRALSRADALADDVLLADEMNGTPLPPQHGLPLRLVVPGWYGMASVKWLTGVTAVAGAFEGYQNAVAYRWRTDPDDAGTPVTRIEPRAVLAPPGFPDFMTRTRVLPAGPVNLVGRAWSGHAPVDHVELSTDAGRSWVATELGADHGRWAWRRFTHRWDAPPGTHELRVRATDTSGRGQPDAGRWNRGGFANNEIQRLDVVVFEPEPA